MALMVAVVVAPTALAHWFRWCGQRFPRRQFYLRITGRCSEFAELKVLRRKSEDLEQRPLNTAKVCFVLFVVTVFF